jgi:murein L,D-transpeptidase YafK
MATLTRLSSGLFSVLVLLAILALLTSYLPGPIPPVQPPLLGQVDHITIHKSQRKMVVYRGGTALKTYKIALGRAPVGDKIRQGDNRTPEGHFRINRRNAGSKFHLSLGLDYPQAADLKRAAAGGYNAGGDIMIHGQPNSVPTGYIMSGDWTAGCIAVTNAEIAEIFTATKMGATVDVMP